MPHPTPRDNISLKHSVGTRLQRAFRKTMLPPCTGRGAEVLLPDRGLLVLGDANLPRPCTVAGPGSPFPPPHNPLTDPPPPTLHHQFVPRLIPHFFQPHAPLAPPTPFSTTLGHALGPWTSAAHGGPRIADKPAMELSASRPPEMTHLTRTSQVPVRTRAAVSADPEAGSTSMSLHDTSRCRRSARSRLNASSSKLG